jgi:predicted ATPase/DNA-binding SARP family transcriptional activator/tetratricopeptide (TPR) repeat protein
VWQIAVLGALEVKRLGRLVPVPHGKASELLVRLAMEPGVQVSTDRLIDDLWSGAVDVRPNTVQSKISRLRRALGDADVITSRKGGYTLAVSPSEVDALVALADTVAASRLLEAGDDRGAAELCTSSLELYRGDVLQTAGDGEWVDRHRAELEEARAKLIETRASARLRLGDVGVVIGELEAAVAAYPFHEGLWELLITGLYRAGRQADALAVYQRVRSRLADELGLDPGTRLRQLEQQILSHDPALGVPHQGGRPSQHEPRAGNLPSMSVELVGRERELPALLAALADERLVEIVGPGGVGKTALAIATGRKFAASGRPGGVWLARLETAATAADVVDALNAAMDVPGGEDALFERLRGSAGLVILDNCEHIVDEVAHLAIRLLDTAPGLRILCTSQVPLEVDGETLVDLDPLPLSDAVQLFARRAAAHRATSAWREGDDAVFGLCRSLDGLPLAIELAAARTRTLSVEEITRRLDDRLVLLNDPTSRKRDRRRSLRSTIRWSYDLLFPDDQRGLWALATFAGGAPLGAVEFVLEALDVPAAAAIDVVGRLASRSLLIVDHDGGPLSPGHPSQGLPPHQVRYRLLDSIRAFALDAMADAGVSERAFGAHATWFGEAAKASTTGVRSDRQAEHLFFVRTERGNIDAALAWSATRDPMLGLGMVNGFGWAWVVLGDSRGAQRIMAALDAAGNAAPARDRAGALLLASWIEASTGRLQLAGDHVAAASEVADILQDVDLRARCSYYLAYVVAHSGEFRRAITLTDRARDLYSGLDRPWDQAANELFAARAAISAGDQERSVAAADQVQHWLRRVSDPWLGVRRDAVLGELARIQHRFDDAVVHIARAAETSRRLGFAQTEAYQLSSLGRAQCQAGNYDAGPATLDLAIAKAEATGDVRLAALARVHLGRVLRAVGDLPGARTALEAAAEWHREAAGGEQALLGECLLAALDAADQIPGATERLAAVLEAALEKDDAPVEVFALDALARVKVVAGDVATARDLCASADRRMPAASHFVTELDRTDARRVRPMIRVRPGDSTGRSAESAPRSPAVR